MRERETVWRKRTRNDNKLPRTKNKIGSNIKECINKFLASVAEGPIYVCTCCHQTWFKISVTPKDKWPKKLDQDFVNLHSTEYKSVGDKEWLCNTCKDSLSKHKTP